MSHVGAIRIGILVILLISVIYTDIAHRKIPNLLTFSAMGLGLGLALGDSLIAEDFKALLPAMASMCAALAIFGFPFYFGWLGGGDLKLMAAIGALQGEPLDFRFIFQATFMTSLVGACMAVLLLIWQGRLLKGLGASVKLIVKPKMKLDETEGGTIPYGVAISIGTLWSLLISL